MSTPLTVFLSLAAMSVSEMQALVADIEEQQVLLEQKIAAQKASNADMQAALEAHQDQCDEQIAELAARFEEHAEMQARRLQKVREFRKITKKFRKAAKITGKYMSVASGTVIFKGCNVHIRNGNSSNSTSSINGKGNLFLTPEYQEECTGCGSHNVVVGLGHSFTSFGSLLGGLNNKATAAHASVPGGSTGTASAVFSLVTGGEKGLASVSYTSVNGGEDNSATASASSISGGSEGSASGAHSSILTALVSEASGDHSVIIGGSTSRGTGVSHEITPTFPACD